jgi:subfamily B ATP-binding cassette protein MsbA
MKIAGLSHIVPLFRWQKRLLARFFLTAIGRSLSSISVLLLIQRFLAVAIDPGSDSRGFIIDYVSSTFGEPFVLWMIGALLLFMQVLASVLNYVNIITQQQISKIVELGMMEKLIRHLLTLSIPFFDKQSHGDIIQAVRTDVTQLRVMIRAMSNIALEGLLALGLLVAAVKISPWLSLLGLVVVPVATLPIYIIAKKTLNASFKIRKTGYLLADIVLQILRGIRVIKVFQGENTQARASVEKGQIFYDNLIDQTRVQRLAAVVMESISGLLIVVVILSGGRRVMTGELSWSSLLTFVMALRAIYGPINNVNTNYLEMQTTGASVQRIAEFLKATPEIKDRPEAASLKGPPKTISFEHVSFSYGDKLVLDDVSFMVRAGETIGIVGPSGGGKSTMLSLLVRFYDPISGAVCFDGRDLRDIKLEDIYKNMALVTQEPFLFATTARENIRCGRPSATDAEVEEAARAAYIHEEILSLPQGYGTPIGMGGRELSGGQRQRISVARALLKNAPILLLDEATSALDSVAEAEVQRAIDQLMVGRTSFAIAHRLSTLRNADRLLVFEAGKCVGMGTHEVLLRGCPVYQRLWEAQRFTSGEGPAAPSPDPMPLSAPPMKELPVLALPPSPDPERAAAGQRQKRPGSR